MRRIELTIPTAWETRSHWQASASAFSSSHHCRGMMGTTLPLCITGFAPVFALLCWRTRACSAPILLFADRCSVAQLTGPVPSTLFSNVFRFSSRFLQLGDMPPTVKNEGQATPPRSVSRSNVTSPSNPAGQRSSSHAHAASQGKLSIVK